MRAATQTETVTWHLGEDALDGSSARKVNLVWMRGGIVTRFHPMGLLELETEIEKLRAAGLDTADLRSARAQLVKVAPGRRSV